MLAWLATAVRLRNVRNASVDIENATISTKTTAKGRAPPMVVFTSTNRHRAGARISCTATVFSPSAQSKLNTYLRMSSDPEHESDEFLFGWFVLGRSIQDRGYPPASHYRNAVRKADQFKQFIRNENDTGS